jgi:hypothetical protein
VAERRLLGHFEMCGDVAQGGVAAGLEEGKDALAPGVHEANVTSFSTWMFKYLLGARPGHTLGTMRRLLAVLLAAHFAFAATPVSAAGLAWEQWKKVAGVLDVDGPRSDGSMIVAGSGALYLLDPAGTLTPFARGPGGYHEDPGTEAYLAISPGGSVSAAECSFVRDEIFLLRLHTPIGVNRVSASGDESGSFANLTGVTMLTGIAFDTAGAFDHRLLVTGQSNGKSSIFAIDCNGAVQVITRSAPTLGGGLAVAPSGFGSFGGALIAPDQLSGRVYAITSNGAVTSMGRPSLRRGAEIGVESVGFVPTGFIGRGGGAYYADRATPQSSHPGTDSLMRLTSAQLGAAGVQDGDMLLATEGGAALDGVHCAATSCTATVLISAGATTHGEGHIAFSLGAAASAPTPTAAPPPGAAPGPVVPARLVVLIGDWGIPAIALLLLVALLGVLGVQSIRHRGR